MGGWGEEAEERQDEGKDRRDGEVEVAVQKKERRGGRRGKTTSNILTVSTKNNCNLQMKSISHNPGHVMPSCFQHFHCDAPLDRCV